jgi:prephenate dehydrogenase
LEHPKGAKFMSEGGAGFRDFTRIAASSPEMWADIFQNNDKALLGLLDNFEETLKQWRSAIQNKDRKFLDLALKRASEYREKWPNVDI